MAYGGFTEVSFQKRIPDKGPTSSVESRPKPRSNFFESRATRIERDSGQQHEAALKKGTECEPDENTFLRVA